MSLVLALLLGGVIGLSLGALGGGGSILTVPVLVYVLSEPAQAATTASLVIVGVSSLIAAVPHARSGHVRWKAAAGFAAAGIPTSLLGTALNRHVDQNLLLLTFAALIVAAAIGMLRRQPADPAAGAEPDGDAGTPARAGSAGTGSAGTRTVSPARSTQIPKIVAAGAVVGFLTGFFGVGGGFVVVPALTLALGFGMPEAVGSSLVILAVNSAVALAARSGAEQFHWQVIVPFTVAAVVGSLAGKRVADRLPGRTLTRAFAVLLLVVAVYVAVRSLTGLL